MEKILALAQSALNTGAGLVNARETTRLGEAEARKAAANANAEQARQAWTKYIPVIVIGVVILGLGGWFLFRRK
jgi:LPXTG-motif cell wall-anchored protein